MKKLIIGAAAFAAIPAITLPMIGGTDVHYHRKPTAGKTRVACVGDSITNGALIPACFFRSYPAELGRLLGNKYQVENYGLNDRTLQAFGNKPYCVEKEYRKSLGFEPDIVVAMLGTNDTKATNWKSVETFADEYVKFIKAYQDLSSKPKIILCLPPWSINADNAIKSLTNDTDANMIPQVIEGIQIAAERLQLPIVNLYSLFENKPQLLNYDGVHPNAKGAKLIANEIVKAILC